MIVSIRKLALLSSIVPALALTGCSDGMLDGPIVIDFQNFPDSGQVQLVTNSPEPVPEPVPQDAMIRVSWDANPIGDNVQYYEVMYGEAENQVDYFYTRTMNETNFDPSAPVVVLQQSDLANANGSSVCFAVKAYNDVAESDLSQAACAAI